MRPAECWGWSQVGGRRGPWVASPTQSCDLDLPHPTAPDSRWGPHPTGSSVWAGADAHPKSRVLARPACAVVVRSVPSWTLVPRMGTCTLGAHVALLFCQPPRLGPGPWMGVQRGRPGPELWEPRAPFPGGHAQEAVRGSPQPAVPFKLLTSSPGSLLMGLLRKVGPDYASCHQRSPVTGCNYAMNTALPVPKDSWERKTWGRVGWGPRVLTGPGSGPHHHGWATSPIMLRHNRAKVIKLGHPASQAMPAATHHDHACHVTGQVVQWRPGLPPWSVSWAGVRFSRLH